MPRLTSLLGATAFVVAVNPVCPTRAQVDPQAAAERLRERTGAAARVAVAASPGVPAGIRLDDGLTADEAVAVALWNNAAFQVSVSELGFARAELLEAGVLANPVLSLLFPIGPKQLEATLRWPVARLAADAASQRLVQAGLDLVLAVRTAHADATLATDRQQLAKETAALLTRIDTLTASRLAAGDIAELDARVARVEAARLGLAADAPAFEVTASSRSTCGPAEDLLREALVARPDVRAAELGVEAAAARLGWEKSRILALTAVLDANGEGREGFEAGPGLDASLPLFNRNQGARARAGAELQRASAAYAAIQQQVALELREATAQFDQASESLAAWRSSIVEPLEANVASAERSFGAGETSYLFVLENTRRLTEARVRERELDADQRRAHARIERAVGRSCGAPPQEPLRDR
jgi:cobalt-zinc-cadmium efflux system outer membrane protein